MTASQKATSSPTCMRWSPWATKPNSDGETCLFAVAIVIAASIADGLSPRQPKPEGLLEGHEARASISLGFEEGVPRNFRFGSILSIKLAA